MLTANAEANKLIASPFISSVSICKYIVWLGFLTLTSKEPDSLVVNEWRQYLLSNSFDGNAVFNFLKTLKEVTVLSENIVIFISLFQSPPVMLRSIEKSILLSARFSINKERNSPFSFLVDFFAIFKVLLSI